MASGVPAGEDTLRKAPRRPHSSSSSSSSSSTGSSSAGSGGDGGRGARKKAVGRPPSSAAPPAACLKGRDEPQRGRVRGRGSPSGRSSSGSSSGSSAASRAGSRGRGRSCSSSSSSSSSSSDCESIASDLSGEEEVDLEVDGGFGVYKDLVVKSDPAPKDANYRADWSGAPAVGTRGFNDFATRAMAAAGVAAGPLRTALDRRAACPPLQPHQETVACLLHPQAPCSRLLVDHPTGSGKTREMINVLDNFFLDPRPKVPVFPKEPVCRNFYAELLRWPSRYRDFFCCLRPQDAARVAGTRDWRARRGELWDIAGLSEAELRQLCASLREVLEMKGWFYMGKMRRSRRDAFAQRFPTESMPGAPLRALRYTSAGGRHTELREDGLPISALLKVAFDYKGKNVYSNKIVIMDEVHNLVRGQTQYSEQLGRLRELLHNAKGAILAGFTGTPILSEPGEGRVLLDIIKGKGAPRCDEGFLSSFPMRPLGLFPASLPLGVPDAVLTPKLRRQLVQRVVLTGEPLKKYDAKRQKGVSDRRLRAYCNLCVHFGSLHDGKSGSRARILANMAACAPKLHAVAQAVAASPEKALVLVARSSGLEALLAHLREVAAASEPPFAVATMDELAAFNAPSNRRGEQFRVMVADSVTCSEGVSFFAVRRMHLVDVPATPSAFVQSVGRALRMHGHAGLPSEEQTVTTVLHVAGLPRWMRSTLGAWAFRAQRRHEDAKVMESGARRLLRRLLSLGIQDLDALKARVDACGMAAAVAGGEKVALDVSQVTNFLEQLGLREEAKSVRLKQQRKAAQPRLRKDGRKVRKKARKGGPQASPRASPRGSPRGSPRASPVRGNPGAVAGARPRAQPVATPQLAGRRAAVAVKAEEKGSASQAPVAAWSGSAPPLRPEDEDTLASLLGKARPGQRLATKGLQPKEETKVPAVVEKLPHWRRDPLVHAIVELHLAGSVEEAAEKLHLSCETADEQTLRELAQKSREFVPALEELRSKAVDRVVLEKYCCKRVKEERESDGESSVHEFGVSDNGSGAEADEKPKEAPLLLPPGWRTEVFRRKKKDFREFVDPAGRRYRTAVQARRAIDAHRTSQNVAERLRTRFAATLAKAAAGGAACKSESVEVKAELSASRTAAAVQALCQAMKGPGGEPPAATGGEAHGRQPSAPPVKEEPGSGPAAAEQDWRRKRVKEEQEPEPARCEPGVPGEPTLPVSASPVKAGLARAVPGSPDGALSTTASGAASSPPSSSGWAASPTSALEPADVSMDAGAGRHTPVVRELFLGGAQEDRRLQKRLRGGSQV